MGGIANLTLSDVDLPNHRAVVHEKGRGGNHKSRYIFFSPITTRAIADYLQGRLSIQDDHLFIGLKRGGEGAGWRGLTESGIYQVIKRLAKLANVSKGFNPHNWRHGAIRGMISNGLNLSIVSQIAGHFSIQVTSDIYGVLSPEELQAAHDKNTWLTKEIPQAEDTLSPVRHKQ